MKIFLSIVFLIILSKIYGQDCVNTKRDSFPAKFVVNNIKIAGNKTTKNKIILRELLFCVGDTLMYNEIGEKITTSRENLLNKSLFNFVTIEKIFKDTNSVEFIIIVEERWYIWPGFNLYNSDRNFSNWLVTKDVDKLTYGAFIDWYNFRGVGETLKFKFNLGFVKEIGLDYRDIYIDKLRQHSISFGLGQKQQNNLFYTNLNNQTKLLKENDVAYKRKYAVFKYYFRNKHFTRHEANISYNAYKVSDTIVKLNPNYLGDANNKAKYLSFYYSIKFDNRDAVYYATKGIYFIAELSVSKSLDKNTLLNQTGIRIRYNKYTPLPYRFNYAFSLTMKKTFSTERPYIMERAIGYADNLRGFEYYVVDGQDFAMYKSNLRFNLVPTQIYEINTFQTNKFKQFNKIHYAIYLNIFSDYAYVRDKRSDYDIKNKLANQLLFSSGIGIDLVTYYDKIISIDFAINKLKEKGVFINFNSPF